MKRLTEKEVNACGIETGFYSVKNGESNTYIHDNLGNPRNLNKMFVAKQKLGQLEDLEEALGIDLLTLFKALKEGVWLKDKNGNCRYAKVTLLSQVKDTFGCSQEETEILGFCLLEQEYGEGLHFQDYGKTWALTKEELE